MGNRALEDYLKAIYKLAHEGDGAAVGTGAVAQALGVSAPSATNMLKRLAAAGLIEHRSRRGVTLTGAGEKAALEVVRHHRLLELYLTEALGYSWDAVHDEADRLEHAVSEELEARLDAILGYPKVDPHGDPIPALDGSVAATLDQPLPSLNPGQAGVVGRVSDADPAKLRYLADLGLVPGAPVTVLDSLPFDGPLRVQVGDVDGSEHMLGRELAAEIFVRKPGSDRGPAGESR